MFSWPGHADFNSGRTKLKLTVSFVKSGDGIASPGSGQNAVSFAGIHWDADTTWLRRKAERVMEMGWYTFMTIRMSELKLKVVVCSRLKMKPICFM